MHKTLSCLVREAQEDIYQPWFIEKCSWQGKVNDTRCSDIFSCVLVVCFPWEAAVLCSVPNSPSSDWSLAVTITLTSQAVSAKLLWMKQNSGSAMTGSNHTVTNGWTPGAECVGVDCFDFVAGLFGPATNQCQLSRLSLCQSIYHHLVICTLSIQSLINHLFKHHASNFIYHSFCCQHPSNVDLLSIQPLIYHWSSYHHLFTNSCQFWSNIYHQIHHLSMCIQPFICHPSSHSFIIHPTIYHPSIILATIEVHPVSDLQFINHLSLSFKPLFFSPIKLPFIQIFNVHLSIYQLPSNSLSVEDPFIEFSFHLTSQTNQLSISIHPFIFFSSNHLSINLATYRPFNHLY